MQQRERDIVTEFWSMFATEEHAKDGYDDGMAGVVERSARAHARDLMDTASVEKASAYLQGYWMGVQRRGSNPSIYRFLG